MLMVSHCTARNLWLAGVTALAACGPTQSVPGTEGSCPTSGVSTQGWERIHLGPFSAMMPPGFSAVDAQPIDSRAGAYRSASGRATVAYDYGWYSSDLSLDTARLTEQTRCVDSIGGKPATIVIGELRDSAENGRYVVAGAWRNVENGSPPVHRTVMSTAHDPMQMDSLLAVVNSVEFR
jgi:hypothetical protein